MLMISCIIVFALVLTWAAKNQNHLLVVFIFVKAPQPDAPEQPQLRMANTRIHN